MLDEEYDKKIKEAADQYHPAYDDAAWDKMEQLLDKHLPQKKRKRRIFFLLPLLLAGGAVFFMVTRNGNRSPSAVAVNTLPENTNHPADIPGSVREENRAGQNNPQPPSVHAAAGNTARTEKVFAYAPPINRSKASWPGTGKNAGSPADVPSGQKAAGKAEKDGGNVNPDPTPVLLNTPSASSAGVPQDPARDETRQDAQLTPPGTLKPEDTLAKTEKTKPAPATARSGNPKKNNFDRNFSLSVSAGPDISRVQGNKSGRLALNFGIGIGYSLSPAFSLRTGFYAARKIYSVLPDDYQPTAGSGNYEYLSNIDADCMVYSIPLNLDYHFAKTSNHGWFVSAGLVSYLMKRETYDYYYKYPSGQTYTKNWTIHNQNQNLISVLNLSGGYQYFFSNRTSVMAEPYLSLPLSGVGAGKVKLKSGGILFTLNVKPFMKKGK